MENLTLETFEDKIVSLQETEWKLKSEKPCIIDFYADWCGPCKMMSPILNELEKENENIAFYKINVDEQPELSAAFGIRSIPSFLFCPINKEPEMIIGAFSKSQFSDYIKEIIL